MTKAVMLSQQMTK